MTPEAPRQRRCADGLFEPAPLQGTQYGLHHKAPSRPAEITREYDYVSALIHFENGELEQEAAVELFQHLVTSGIIRYLQGSYQRAAADLISSGLVAP